MSALPDRSNCRRRNAARRLERDQSNRWRLLVIVEERAGGPFVKYVWSLRFPGEQQE
jgi:uncharacterized protein (DUF2384 family)